ncbi:hypothetical protein KQH51_05185 [bacterium]|nr:hypothetical protein [bacterium]MCB2202310.1 hypothetical protein [bacterium]
MARLLHTKTIGVLVLVTLLVVTFGCGKQQTIRPDEPFARDADDRPIEEVESVDPSLVWQTVDRTVFVQAEQALNLRRGFGTFWGSPIEAANINRFDEVPDCAWFTNRHGLSPMSPEAILTGTNITPGPDTTGEWLVFRPKIQGATVGFWIEDSRGDEYIIKFDPAGYAELATGAAAMGSRYFHACGYNAPQETIVHWRPEWLRIKEGATIRGSDGVKRPMTREDIDAILERVQRQPDGSIRSLASLSLGKTGAIKGPFAYDGRRGDDPNDWCDHEDRRELRALYVIASLVNHYDLKDQNTLDIFVRTDGDRGYLRHYLIDFGSTFGSDGRAPKHPRKGYANGFDLKDVMVNWLTLGLRKWAWENNVLSPYPSVGMFESKNFRPEKFDPIVPNPAFDNMTDRDAYWGAKIVMAWRDEHLRALIDAGEYTDPEAKEYLFTTLVERRDKIGRYWFSKVNPLDHFEVMGGAHGMLIAFEDLAVKYGLAPGIGNRYHYVLKYDGDKIVSGETGETAVVLSISDLASMAEAYKPGHEDKNHLYRLEIRTERQGNKPGKPTVVWLWYDDEQSIFEYVGLEHVG